MMCTRLAGTSVPCSQTEQEPAAAMGRGWESWSKRGGHFPSGPSGVRTDMRLQKTFSETKPRFAWVQFQTKQDLP